MCLADTTTLVASNTLEEIRRFGEALGSVATYPQVVEFP